MDLLEIKNVDISFDKGAKAILKGVNLSINNEDFIGIVGKSGIGKTTLMKIIGGLLRPDSGEVIFDNKNIYEMKDNELAKYRNEVIGFVFQDYGILPHYTVYENLVTPLYFSTCLYKDFANRVDLVTERLNIKHLIKVKASKLSGGEKQRVAIARALINNPKVILADEPTAALDGETSKEVVKTLKAISENGTAVIVVTHDDSLAKQCKRLYRIDGVLLIEEK